MVGFQMLWNPGGNSEELRVKEFEGWTSYATTALLYVIAYVVLDRISFLHPFSEVGITPWDPPQGLTLAILLRLGLRYAPVVPIAMFTGELLVRHLASPWLPVLPTLTASLITAAGYVGAAFVLLYLLRIDPGLRRLNDFVGFLIVGLIAALVVACGVVGNFHAFGMISAPDFWPAVLRSWLGDFVGILTLAPAMLVFTCGFPGIRRGEPWQKSILNALEIVAQVLAIAGTVWLVFGLDFVDELKLFYLLFLPVIWVAVRHGLPGAAASVLLTQVGLKVAFQARGFGAVEVVDFQMLMVALGLTGLLVGAIVSERRLASQALSESEARLKAILHTAPDAIFTLVGDGCIESANPAVEQMFGWPAKTLVGGAFTLLLPDLDPGLPGAPRETLGQRRDGTRFPAEVAVGSAATATGQRYIVVVRDVSRRVEAESLVRQHQVQLAHVDRLSIVGEMATTIVHEESQPLAAIAAYTRACRMLLQQPEIDLVKVRLSLDKLAAQTVRAGDVLSRMRGFLHRGEIEAVPESVMEIVHEVAEFAKTDVSEHGIRLQLDVEPGVPLVAVDRIHIQQVILNLVRNAVDAISEAGSDIREIRITARRKGMRVVFDVHDTGPGIDPEIAERLFSPFTTTKDRGMGLGLSISRTIVAAHGGQLRWIPEETPGTTFRFDLPVAVVVDDGISSHRQRDEADDNERP
ncbi:MAG: ATP-binding protein [Rhodospirillaceae bacterium]